MKYALITAWLTLAFLLMGCHTVPSPEEVLAKSRDAMTRVESYRFRGEVVQKTENGVLTTHQSGAWGGAARWRVRYETTGEGVHQVTETIRADRRLFRREPGSDGGSWQVWTSQDGPVIDEPIPNSDPEDLKMLEDDAVNGVPVFTIAGERRREHTPSQSPNGQANPVKQEGVTRYTWLIAKEDYRLMRRIIEHDNGPLPHRTTMDFYDHNQPVTIEAP